MMTRKSQGLERQHEAPGLTKPETIDEYILRQEKDTALKLEKIRRIIREAVPDAEEKISWSMPTFWKGKDLIHFAAFKKHVGIYPGDEAVSAFKEELVCYDVSRGTIRIPYDAPLPEELIARIAKWCYEKYAR